MAEIIPIHSLYFHKALKLRRTRRELLSETEYRLGIEAGERAQDAERRGIEIRDRMASSPWARWIAAL